MLAWQFKLPEIRIAEKDGSKNPVLLKSGRTININIFISSPKHPTFPVIVHISSLLFVQACTVCGEPGGEPDMFFGLFQMLLLLPVW